MKKFLFILLLAQSAYGTLLVQGNAATLNSPVPPATTATPNPNASILTFSQPVNARAYDIASGTLYVGLANLTQPTPPTLANTLAPALAYAVSKVSRPTDSTNSTFLPIASNALLSSGGVVYLTLAPSVNNLPPNLALSLVGTSTTSSLNTVILCSANGATVQQTASLVDASGAAANGIAQLAANPTFVFAAVQPDGGTFGSPNSGIAVVSFNPINLLSQQTAAQPGNPTIKAALLDPTSPQIAIYSDPTIASDLASLYWDAHLQRLYVGLQLSTTGTAGDGARSVVVGQLNPALQNGTLTLYDFLPNDALTEGAVNNIVGVLQNSTTSLSLAAANLKTMHTTTGASYLILQGGNGTISTNGSLSGTVGNNIWALPLVDVGTPSNAAQGTLADKNDFNSNTGRFETPATMNSQVTTTTDAAALVGQGPLPVQAKTPYWGTSGLTATTTDLSTLDLVVMGDTVYVSLANPPTSSDDTGVFYSQAMFDGQGKISSWTTWAKRGLPFNPNPFPKNLPIQNSQVLFVDVDAVTGKVWAVIDGELWQTVVSTGWDSGQFMSPLPQVVNAALSSGCLSVLDLDQSTQGLGQFAAERYALFGGVNTVAFVITSSSTSPTPPFSTPASQSPQTVISDFSTPQNFLVTSLPGSSGGVKVLEYSRRLSGEGATNYFFAGTDQGLFVFADSSGNGFDVTQLSTLDVPPFAGGSWKLVPNIAGSVVDIKTSGLALYVLTVQSGPAGSVSTLYSVPFTTNSGTMFAPGNIDIIAQSGVGSLSGTAALYGMQIISIATNETAEQLALGTNNGLFVSTNGAGVQAATSQAAAGFTAISPDNGKTQYYGSIAGIDTPTPSTVWPVSLQDPTGLGIYGHSSVFQLSGGEPGDTIDNFGFDPVPFNADSSAPQFATLPRTTYFWSDGARRFFIVQPQGCGPNNSISSRMLVLPYDVVGQNVTTPTDLTDSVLNGIGRIYWVKSIGATGIVMAGTGTGVIALE